MRPIYLIAVILKITVIWGVSQELAPKNLTEDDVIFTQNGTNTSQNEKKSIQIFPNSVEASVRFEDYTDLYNNRSYFYLQYGRQFSRTDVFVKSLRYTLGEIEGYQFESELYHRFKKQGYTYFDAAWSDATILPNYRLRAEVFQNIQQLEFSLGAGIVKPHNFKEIPLFTGTLGYYFSDYFVYARPTFSYVDNGFTKSFFVQGRRYFTKTNFVAVSLLRGSDTGTSRNINAMANQFGSDTYLARLSSQFKINRYKISAGIDHGGIKIPERNEYARFIGFDLTLNREF
jgi:YaiO family outer membrane protein